MGLIANLVFGRRRAARLRSARRSLLWTLLLPGLGRPFGFSRLCAGSALGSAALVALWQPDAAALAALRLTARAQPASVQAVPRALPLCGAKARSDCVVDGDTLWLSGQKIRIADINTPETAQPGCAREKRLGEAAKRRLQALVNQGPFELKRQGRDADRYGRKLRVLVRNGRSLGQALVAEGLAEPWNGRRRDWCA